MKNYYQIFVIITIILSVYACSNNPLQQSTDNEETKVSESTEKGKYDFRKTTWGMSKSEVMETEEGEPVLNSVYKIDYDTKMMSFDSKISYTFNDDELIRASFLLLDKPETNSGYIEIYKEIQRELKTKYGKTVIDTVQHKDPSVHIEPSNYPDAVCNGDLLYATQWDTPSSDIQLLLRGENSECYITIMYISEEGFRQMLREKKNPQ